MQQHAMYTSISIHSIHSNITYLTRVQLTFYRLLLIVIQEESKTQKETQKEKISTTTRESKIDRNQRMHCRNILKMRADW